MQKKRENEKETDQIISHILEWNRREKRDKGSPRKKEIPKGIGCDSRKPKKDKE